MQKDTADISRYHRHDYTLWPLTGQGALLVHEAHGTLVAREYLWPARLNSPELVVGPPGLEEVHDLESVAERQHALPGGTQQQVGRRAQGTRIPKGGNPRSGTRVLLRLSPLPHSRQLSVTRLGGLDRPITEHKKQGGPIAVPGFPAFR